MRADNMARTLPWEWSGSAQEVVRTMPWSGPDFGPEGVKKTFLGPGWCRKGSGPRVRTRPGVAG
jgi:hypothetical protein